MIDPVEVNATAGLEAAAVEEDAMDAETAEVVIVEETSAGYSELCVTNPLIADDAIGKAEVLKGA